MSSTKDAIPGCGPPNDTIQLLSFLALGPDGIKSDANTIVKLLSTERTANRVNLRIRRLRKDMATDDPKLATNVEALGPDPKQAAKTSAKRALDAIGKRADGAGPAKRQKKDDTAPKFRDDGDDVESALNEGSED